VSKSGKAPHLVSLRGYRLQEEESFRVVATTPDTVVVDGRRVDTQVVTIQPWPAREVGIQGWTHHGTVFLADHTVDPAQDTEMVERAEREEAARFEQDGQWPLIRAADFWTAQEPWVFVTEGADIGPRSESHPLDLERDRYFLLLNPGEAIPDHYEALLDSRNDPVLHRGQRVAVAQGVDWVRLASGAISIRTLGGNTLQVLSPVSPLAMDSDSEAIAFSRMKLLSGMTSTREWDQATIEHEKGHLRDQLTDDPAVQALTANGSLPATFQKELRAEVEALAHDPRSFLRIISNVLEGKGQMLLTDEVPPITFEELLRMFQGGVNLRARTDWTVTQALMAELERDPAAYGLDIREDAGIPLRLQILGQIYLLAEPSHAGALAKLVEALRSRFGPEPMEWQRQLPARPDADPLEAPPSLNRQPQGEFDDLRQSFLTHPAIQAAVQGSQPLGLHQQERILLGLFQERVPNPAPSLWTEVYLTVFLGFDPKSGTRRDDAAPFAKTIPPEEYARVTGMLEKLLTPGMRAQWEPLQNGDRRTFLNQFIIQVNRSIFVVV
jgi:hypothetical protein